eukprot:6123216-Alexandrium_andersonii.AAC.1
MVRGARSVSSALKSPAITVGTCGNSSICASTAVSMASVMALRARIVCAQSHPYKLNRRMGKPCKESMTYTPNRPS